MRRGEVNEYEPIANGERSVFPTSAFWRAWLYEQLSFPQQYIQALMDHAYVKMTKHDQEGHTEKGIEYLEVGVLHIADKSSRRRIHIRRPLTPPYVRFRIRRFRLCG